MKSKTHNEILLLTLAGAALVALNVEIWLLAKVGVMGAIENVPLWKAIVTLNVIAILWAVSQLGLHPLIVALSYVTGGFMAYRGVHDIPGISVAEITTAGATYGAFGSLVVGSITTKVRFVFFNQKQVPFVFVILGLLAVDGILNSRVSHSDWNTILNALVFPFVLAGGIVGMLWFVVSRLGLTRKKAPVAVPNEEVSQIEERLDVEESDTGSSHLVIQIPENVEETAEPEPLAATLEKEDLEEEPEAAVIVAEEEPPKDAVAEPEEEFFPLEIDKDETALPMHENHGLLEIAAMVADEPVADDAIVLQPQPVEPEPEIVVVEDEPEPAVQTAPAEQPSEKTDSDWLSGHLDLLNKIK